MSATQVQQPCDAESDVRSSADPTRPPPGESSSDELVWAHFARTECERSFEVIFARYAPRIRGFLLRRIGDEAQAEDLTQNVFVRLIRAKSTYDPRRNFSTWAHTIASNVLKNHYRSASRNRLDLFTDLRPRPAARAGLPTVDPVFDAVADEPSPDVEAYRNQLRTRVAQAVAQVDPACRAAFLLHQMEGLPYEAVADRLGLPIGTVKHRAQRAKAEVRRALAGLAGRESAA